MADNFSDMLKWNMVIKTINISDLVINDFFSISVPVKPDSYPNFSRQCPQLPAIIVNKNNHIIFGIDFYYHLKDNSDSVTVLQLDIPDLDALSLSFNLKSKLLSVNLLEKLVFIDKILPLTTADDLYQRTGLDIPVDENLRAKLPQLLAPEFAELLISERVSFKTGLKLVDMAQKTRHLLINLFLLLPFTHSQQKQIIDLAEDILFRDKCSLAEVFDRLDIYGKQKTEKAQKKIISALFQDRYPQYSKREEDWHDQLDQWQLPAPIKVDHFPFFEKEEIVLSIKIKDLQQLKETLTTLKFIR